MKTRMAILTIVATFGLPSLLTRDLSAQEGGEKNPPRRGEGGRGEGGRGEGGRGEAGRGEGGRGEAARRALGGQRGEPGGAGAGPQRAQARNGNGPGALGGPGGFDGSLMFGQLMKALPLVKALDADSDGELSTVEIENASKSLMKLDTNGDGKLSTDELKPNPSEVMPGGMAGLGRGGEGRPGMGGEMLARMFEQRDANGDGMLSGEEIPERMQPMVARVDKNGDGNISKDEFKQVQAGMMERMRDGQAPGGRRGGDEGEGPAKPKRPN